MKHETQISREQMIRQDDQGEKRTGGVAGMNWPTAQLGAVTKIVSGSTPKSGNPAYWGGPIPWATPTDLSGLATKELTSTGRQITEAGFASCSANMLPPRSVLFSSRAPIGLVAINKQPLCTNQGFKSFVPDASRLSPDYLFWWLKGNRPALEHLGRGATFKEVSKSIIETVEIPLPPLAEQKRIAAILDAADALRTKRRESLAQLDALLQSTFLTLFGDPVANPMGWEQVELGDLVADDDRINYGVVQPGDDHPGGKPLIRVGDFVGGELDLSGIKFIDPKIDAQYERSQLLGTELLVSCVGSIGTVCRVPLAAKGHNIARAVARVPLGPKVEREFMLFCLRSSGVQNYFASETRTVSQPTLNIGLIKAATVTVPPLPLQQKFAAIVESVERQKAAQRAHLAELDALFAALQHRAFRGEL